MELLLAAKNPMAPPRDKSNPSFTLEFEMYWNWSSFFLARAVRANNVAKTAKVIDETNWTKLLKVVTLVVTDICKTKSKSLLFLGSHRKASIRSFT